MQDKVGCRAARRSSVDSVAPPRGNDWGWYLYGIVRSTRKGAAEAVTGAGLDGSAPVEMLSCRDLAAVVSRVPLAELGAEAIRARLRDLAWLEVMVRGHERVVEAIHWQGTILPAKFGSVYASSEALIGAIEETYCTLSAQIERLKECDEWGLRLLASHPAISQRLMQEDKRVQQLQHELATASPGRAYFFRRQLADLLAATTDQKLCDVAQAGYDFLARYAIAAQLCGRPSVPHRPEDEVGVLRAAFLVSRSAAPAFTEAIQRFTESEKGLSCEYSGPWPPYSFVATNEGALGSQASHDGALRSVVPQ